jgi:nucleotide-binding universal stress UspA family protein
MFEKLLVAVDRAHAEASQEIFERALSLAKSLQAELVVMSVMTADYATYVNPPIYPGGEAITINEAAMKIYLEQQEKERATGIKFLQELAERANNEGVKTEISHQMGDPGNKICEAADTQGVDLIVLGRRGHTGLNELLMGSVSNYVLHHAPCSVLTIQGGGIKK